MNSGATNTFFITVQYLKDNTIINDNVDDNLLRPLIATAHDKYLHPLIGSGLYYALQNKVSTGSLTGNYKFLMDGYIVPFLLHYTTYEAVPFMAFKFRNKGVSKQNSEYSTPAELDELHYVRDNVLSTAQFYGERLIDYICAHNSDFPEYSTVNNGDLSSANNDTFLGIHVPGYNRGTDCFKGLGLTRPFNF